MAIAIILGVVFTGSIGSLLVIPSYALAMPVNPIVADAKSEACAGIGLTGASCTGDDAQTKAQDLISFGINLFSVIVGVAAVIMIIVAGMRYTLSGGDTTKTNSAKSTIIYALVGLVVVALSQLLVHFVLNNAK